MSGLMGAMESIRMSCTWTVNRKIHYHTGNAPLDEDVQVLRLCQHESSLRSEHQHHESSSMNGQQQYAVRTAWRGVRSQQLLVNGR